MLKMRRSKKLVAVLAVVATVLAVGGAAYADSIIDAIKIERAAAPDTFTVSFLYNSYQGDEENPFQWEYYDLMISAEPIGQSDPVTERLFTPGEILVGPGNGYLYSGGYDWTSANPPYQAVQITASNDTYSGLGTWPIDTPLFSFTYTGSASEFVIYNSIISQEVEAGRIPVPVPEPCAIVLLVMGGFGLIAYAWRRRRS
jgi:hypothetical protein